VNREIRPPAEDDVASVVELMNRHWPEPVDEERVRLDWTSPRVRLQEDARIGDGAFVLVEDLEDGRVWVELHGDLPLPVLEWAESRAAEIGATKLWTGGWSTETAKLAELERRGYSLIRRSQRMEIDLRGSLPPPNWPDGIGVRTVRSGEERALYDVHQEVFRDAWGSFNESFEEWEHRLVRSRNYVPELRFLAVDGDEIAGYAVCYPQPTTEDLGWVGILGVRRPWRRRGLGRALLLHAFHAFRERGLTRAGLGVDSDSPTGAHTLYEDAGMQATHEFDVYEKIVA
jgi:mycothiol synthase